jgi:hypothetical protein
MRAFLVVFLAASSIATTGCGDLLTLHALYTKQDQVFDPAIEGLWESKDDLLMVKRSEEGYEVALQAKGINVAPSRYEAHLTEIGGVRFADLLPDEHIGHMIVRVRSEAGALKLAFLDSQWLRDRVQHENAETEDSDTQAVLTLRTPQLKNVVAKYATENRAYDEEVEFTRAHPGQVQQARN